MIDYFGRIRTTQKIWLCCAYAMLAFIPKGAASAGAEKATDWVPEKTITITAPSNPGGGWDQIARFLQHTIATEKLSPAPIEVVNRGGAGGTIGLAELVDRYTGDPYKLMVSGFGMSGAVLMHDSEHQLTSATVIARLTSEYQAVGVVASSPYQTLDDLLEAFRADPDAVSWGGGSAGGADHVFANLLAEKAGVAASKVNYVAFTGGGEASAALMGGQVTAGISGYAEWAGLVESGRARLLAISAPERLEGSDLPTFRELGLDLTFQNWRCILAAPGISEAERAWITTMITNTRNSETWQALLKRNNWQDTFLVGDEFEAFIKSDSAVTKRILDRIGLGAGGKGYAVVGPFFFPTVIGIGLLLAGGFIALSAFRKGQASVVVPHDEAIASLDIKRFGMAVVSIFIYILLIQFVGFMFVTPVFVTVLSRLIGSKAPVRDFAAGLGLTLVITYIFENFLNVEIP